MWYGVVHMQQIQLFIADDINEFAGKGSFVWSKLKEGVVKNCDLVIKEIFRKEIEPYGLTISYKMHFMPFSCEGLAKFCCNNPASSKGGITNNTNFHRLKFMPQSYENFYQI